MAKISNTSISTNISHRVILAILVIFISLSAFIFILGRYYKLDSEVSNQVVKTENRDDQIKRIKEEYKINYLSILNSYLDNASKTNDLLANIFLNKTKEVKHKLLELRVSAELKDYHLSTILLLESIEKNINSSNDELVVSGLSDLSEIVNSF